MAHFAELDENSLVSRVVVVNDAYEVDGENWCKEFFGTDNWKQTSYNTYGGVHFAPNSEYISDNGIPLRKNYAGIGYIYSPTLDAFYSPQPFDSWSLDEDTCQWEAPIPHPDDGNKYIWNESTVSWGLWNSV